MEDESFNNKILGQIQNDGIKPRSRWLFTTEHWLFVTIIAVTTFIGSIAVATTLFILTDHDWFAVSYLDEGIIVHVLKTIPYLWLLIILIVVVIITSNVKRLDRGYRITAWKVVLVSLLASMSVGSALYLSGAGEYLDTYLDKTVPSYRTLVKNNTAIWIHPEKGLLSGYIQSVSTDSFVLKDAKQQTWTVAISTKTSFDPRNIIPGKHIKTTGTMIGSGNFVATEVLPWRNERK